MNLVQKIASADQIESRAMHVQAMAWVLMSFAVILGLYLLYARLGKSHLAKSFHESDESTAVNVFWLLIIVGIIFGLMIFANNLPKKQMTDAGCDMIEKTLMFKSDSDGIDNYVTVPILVHGKNYQIGEVVAEYDNGDDEETLVNAYVDFNKKTVVYRANGKTGKAFMQVCQYVQKHYRHPVNIKWSIVPSCVQVRFDDENGEHKFVCFVNNRKQKIDKDVKEINFETGDLK